MFCGPEIRRPKAETRKQAEIRNQKSAGRAGGWTFSVFGLRISFGFRCSGLEWPGPTLEQPCPPSRLPAAQLAQCLLLCYVKTWPGVAWWRSVKVAAQRGSDNTVEESNSMKPVRQSPLKVHGCRGCPCRTPSGRCLDTRIKSGRCGDWVWYVSGNKQLRHLYVKPRDPRTPRQLAERARFSAASKHYRDSLTQDQRNALIAAGAKFQSRPRLAQSGPLTGQQYAIRLEYAAEAEGRMPKAESTAKGPPIQGISLPTSELPRSVAGGPPAPGRRVTGRVTGRERRGQNGEGSRHSVRTSSEVRQGQGGARSCWKQPRRATVPTCCVQGFRKRVGMAGFRGRGLGVTSALMEVGRAGDSLSWETTDLPPPDLLGILIAG